MPFDHEPIEATRLVLLMFSQFDPERFTITPLAGECAHHLSDKIPPFRDCHGEEGRDDPRCAETADASESIMALQSIHARDCTVLTAWCDGVPSMAAAGATVP